MDKKLYSYKLKLLALRRKYNKEFHELEDEGAHISLKEAAGGDITAYPTHLADIASDSYELEHHLINMGNVANILQQIDEALYKIEKGSYGLCEVCGKEIQARRLQAIPYTSLCIHCAKKT